MARETKQDRLVRSMFDQVVEHAHQLKALSGNPATKELDVERWCDSVIRSCLGYTATNGYSVRAQETRGKLRPDLVVFKNEKPVLVVEVKKLGYDLNKSDFRSGKTQLSEYLHSLGDVQWGILCNGYEWRLMDFSEPATGGIEVASFDLRGEKEELDTGKRAVEEMCWSLVDLHEAGYSDGAWKELSKEATAFSPESLARAILSLDAVRYIAKVIKGEFDYRANTEVLFDKVVDLIERGLDDSVHDWNETKQAELNKYVSSQKRASRKRKPPSKQSGEVVHTVEVAANDPGTDSAGSAAA